MSVPRNGMRRPTKCEYCLMYHYPKRGNVWCRNNVEETQGSLHIPMDKPRWCPLKDINDLKSGIADKRDTQTGGPSEAVQEATRVINAWLSENDGHDIKIAEAYTKEGLRRKIVLIYPLRDKFYRPEDGVVKEKE